MYHKSLMYHKNQVKESKLYNKFKGIKIKLKVNNNRAKFKINIL